MSNERTLVIWVAAANGDVDAMATLQNHWFSGTYKIPEGVLASNVFNSTS